MRDKAVWSDPSAVKMLLVRRSRGEAYGALTAAWERLMDDEPEQEALFEIEGPDEDGCVWICSAAGRDVWCQNLGPKEAAAAKLCEWLGSIDYLEDC